MNRFATVLSLGRHGWMMNFGKRTKIACVPVGMALVFFLTASAVASPSARFQVSQAWVGGVLVITGKTNLPDGTRLKIGIVDKDGVLVAHEGFVPAEVSGGLFVVEGFTKDGSEPLAPGRYKVSIQNESGGVLVEKPITVIADKRPETIDEALKDMDAAATQWRKEGQQWRAAHPLSPLRGVTYAGYKALKTGMTYAEVVKILGKEGTELGRSGEDIGFPTVLYVWDSADGRGNLQLMFQNGRLVQKNQLGLPIETYDPGVEAAVRALRFPQTK